MNFSGRLKYFRSFSYWPEMILFLSFLICIFKLDITWFSAEMSRDLSRSIDWLSFKSNSWLGPEIDLGSRRLPGPFFYWIIGFFWSLTHSITGILFLKILFTKICVYVLIKELKKNYSLAFVLFFSLQFLLMPVYLETLRNLWSPSLIVSFCCLLFSCALKFQSTNKPIWIWLAGLTAFVGLQIHFSVLIPYLAFLICLLLFKNRIRIVVFQILILVVFLTLWNCFVPGAELQQQANNFYKLSTFLASRFSDLSFHLSLSLKPIQDYDLFTVLTKTSVRLGWISAYFVNILNPFLNLAVLVVYLCSLIYFIYRKFKIFKFIEMFSLLWFLFFVMTYFTTKDMIDVPYRNGLCLYPIQFFLLMLALDNLHSLFQRKIILFYILLIIISTSHLYFILNFYKFQNLTARTHQTQNDNLELNLKTKKYIYSLVDANNAGLDPFMLLHGRSISKMRLNEMNTKETELYFGLYRSITGQSTRIQSEIKDLPSQNSWLFQLRSFNELKLNPRSPFLVSELKTENLPSDLVLKYLNSDSDGIGKSHWANTNLIMPLAFLQKDSAAKNLRLEFKLNSSENKYLNLILDDNNIYNFGHQANYKLLQVRFDKKAQSPVEKYQGYLLVQNQYIFKIPNRLDQVKVVIELKIETTEIPNFSRLDIFTTPYLLSAEELP